MLRYQGLCVASGAVCFFTIPVPLCCQWLSEQMTFKRNLIYHLNWVSETLPPENKHNSD